MHFTWCHRAIRLLSAAGVFLQVGCAALLTDIRDSDLPIEIDPASSMIARTKAFEANGKLYVSGSVERSFGPLSAVPSHIDVLLIDQAGEVLAGKEDRVGFHDGQPSRRRCRATFVVNFDIPTARQSASIHVVWCQSRGAGCLLKGA
jgi:hypothetical protein